jgi:hypothetical protein
MMMLLLAFLCVMPLAIRALQLQSGCVPIFPTLNDTLEMAMLSSMMYAFRKEDCSSNLLCDRINRGNITIDRPIPDNIQCRWYHHDRRNGVQAMIVSSAVKRYIAVVFTGTVDVRTALTDANILMTEFGSNSGGDDQGPYPDINVSLQDPSIRVHAGFNHDAFDHNLFGEIVVRSGGNPISERSTLYDGAFPRCCHCLTHSSRSRPVL